MASLSCAQCCAVTILVVLAAAVTAADWWQTTTTTGRPPTDLGSPSLTGTNVCSHTTWETTIVERNVTCRCWVFTRVSGSCDDDDDDRAGRSWWGRHRRRHHRHRVRRGEFSDWDDDDDDDDDGGVYTHQHCYTVSLATCYRTVRTCIRQPVNQYYCCEGYEDNGRGQCQAISQCGTNNGGCGQLCVHDVTMGHHCTCFPGYTLSDDGHMCVDVDECTMNNGGCSHQCVNTVGSFYCTCNPGYILTGPTDCTEMDECAVGNGECQHDCINTDGGFYCQCREGYTLVGGKRCEDVNECDTHNGGCSHQCVNRLGWYYCRCPQGMMLEEDGPNCQCPQGAYMLEDMSSCVCPEGLVMSPDNTQCIPEVDGPVVVVPPGPQSPVAAQPSTDNDSAIPLGLLVGIPVAGVFFLVALIIALCCFIRRCRRRRPPLPVAAAAPPVAAGGATGGAVVAFIKVPLEKKKKKEILENEYSVAPSEKKALDPPQVKDSDTMSHFSVPPSYQEATGYDVPRSHGNHYDSPSSKPMMEDPPAYDGPDGNESVMRYETPGEKTPHAYTNLAYSAAADEKEKEANGEDSSAKGGVADKVKRFQSMMEK